MMKIGRHLLPHTAAQPSQEQDERNRSADGEDSNKDLCRLTEELTAGDRNESVLHAWSVASIPRGVSAFARRLQPDKY